MFGNKLKYPKDDQGKLKLSFAFCNLTQFDENLLPKNCNNVIELDLTENNFEGSSDLRFLLSFPQLETLILDKNQIQSNIILPFMEKLKTLWVNHNKIEQLALFIKRLCDSCPNLTYLSMLNNKAAPSYFNGGSVNEYKDYRLYVISKLQKLKMLDDKEITDEERKQAFKIYGKTIYLKPNTQQQQQKQKQKLNQESKRKAKTKYDTNNSIKTIDTQTQNDNSVRQFTQLPISNIVSDKSEIENLSDNFNKEEIEDLPKQLQYFNDNQNSNSSEPLEQEFNDKIPTNSSEMDNLSVESQEDFNGLPILLETLPPPPPPPAPPSVLELLLPSPPPPLLLLPTNLVSTYTSENSDTE